MTGNECGGRGSWPQAGGGNGLAQEDALIWLVDGDGLARDEAVFVRGRQPMVETSVLGEHRAWLGGVECRAAVSRCDGWGKWAREEEAMTRPGMRWWWGWEEGGGYKLVWEAGQGQERRGMWQWAWDSFTYYKLDENIINDILSSSLY